MRTFLSILKKIILWSYQRGSWQYDILCILILLFIVLTPSDWFNPEPDSPRSRVEQLTPLPVDPISPSEPASGREEEPPKESSPERPQP